jgi:hypothetical protein
MSLDSRTTSSSRDEFEDQGNATTQSRLFLLESGWRISIKTDSQRAFCFMMAPGQDFYHSLLDGEIFLHRGEQRFCMACAVRRGLVALRPKHLPEVGVVVPANVEPIPFDVEADPHMRPRDFLFGP